MKTKKSLPRIRTTALACALMTAGFLFPLPGSAVPLSPQAKVTRRVPGRPPLATAKKITARLAARPVIARKPLTKTPVGAALPPGGQLLLQMRSGIRLTPAAVSHLSQVAGKHLTVTHNYGEGQYIVLAHGAVGVNALRSVSNKLKTNSNVLRANPYTVERPAQVQAVPGHHYALLDPAVMRNARMRNTVLMLKPVQILGDRTPITAVTTLRPQSNMATLLSPVLNNAQIPTWVVTPSPAVNNSMYTPIAGKPISIPGLENRPVNFPHPASPPPVNDNPTSNNTPANSSAPSSSSGKCDTVGCINNGHWQAGTDPQPPSKSSSNNGGANNNNSNNSSSNDSSPSNSSSNNGRPSSNPDSGNGSSDSSGTKTGKGGYTPTIVTLAPDPTSNSSSDASTCDANCRVWDFNQLPGASSVLSNPAPAASSNASSFAPPSSGDSLVDAWTYPPVDASSGAMPDSGAGTPDQSGGAPVVPAGPPDQPGPDYVPPTSQDNLPPVIEIPPAVPATPPSSPPSDAAQAPAPAPAPDTLQTGGWASPEAAGPMSTGLGMESVRKPRIQGSTPAGKTNIQSLLKQHRILGFHLTTIDQNGIAHGRDMYLLVQSVRLAKPAARPAAASRKPKARVTKPIRSPLRSGKAGTVQRKPLRALGTSKR